MSEPEFVIPEQPGMDENEELFFKLTKKQMLELKHKDRDMYQMVQAMSIESTDYRDVIDQEKLKRECDRGLWNVDDLFSQKQINEAAGLQIKAVKSLGIGGAIVRPSLGSIMDSDDYSKADFDECKIGPMNLVKPFSKVEVFQGKALSYYRLIEGCIRMITKEVFNSRAKLTDIKQYTYRKDNRVFIFENTNQNLKAISKQVGSPIALISMYSIDAKKYLDTTNEFEYHFIRPDGSMDEISKKEFLSLGASDLINLKRNNNIWYAITDSIFAKERFKAIVDATPLRSLEEEFSDFSDSVEANLEVLSQTFIRSNGIQDSLTKVEYYKDKDKKCMIFTQIGHHMYYYNHTVPDTKAPAIVAEMLKQYNDPHPYEADDEEDHPHKYDNPNDPINHKDLR